MLPHFWFSDATNAELNTIANQLNTEILQLNESIVAVGHSVNVLTTMFNQMSVEVDGLAAGQAQTNTRVATIESQQAGKLIQ